MKTFKYIQSVIFLLILSMTACTEKIDVTLDNTYTRLVVDAVITSDTTVHRVKLSTTTDYFSNQVAPAVSNAIVTISDGSTTVTLNESPTSPGVYVTENNYYAVPGRTYKLNIKLATAINDKTDYEASSQMETVAPLDSIKLKDVHQFKAVAIQTYAQDPISVNFYMFKAYINHVLISDTLNEVFITDDILFNGSYTNGIAASYLDQKKPDEKIKAGDTVSLQISGITSQYYYFLLDVSSSTGFSNPLFGGPPANVRGNISNGAIGFFAAYSVHYASTIVQ